METDSLESSHLSPPVSVTLVVYNEKPEYLASAVESVMTQSHKNFEFIIVDDSDDKQLTDYLRDAAGRDNRIVYIHNEKRGSRTKARNQALRLARGEYVAIVDSDDIQHKDRLAAQVEYLESNKDIGIVGTPLKKINKKGDTIGIRSYPSSPKSVSKLMMFKNALAQPGVMIRKQAIDNTGFYDESFEKAEDYELWMRAITRGIKIANLEYPAVGYRVSDVQKRDNTNWKYNLMIKLRYFAFDRYIAWRIAGIAAVGLMVAMPAFVKRFLYSMYNRMV
jgi:glycosyltransferase involved in cell wall biosynthesis